MGWIARGENRLNNYPMLWPENELPQSAPKLPERNFKSLCYPLWTQNKARLIQAYLQLFEYITKHGTYIDGFAAPQDAEHLDMWSAKLVLEMVRRNGFATSGFAILVRAGIEKLRTLEAEHASLKQTCDGFGGRLQREGI